MSKHTGSIVTVDGCINPDELGITITHEHLFVDFDILYTPPQSAFERRIAREPVSLENLWFIRRNTGKNLDNLRLESFDEAVDEVSRYYQYGGGTIVDVTPKNLGSDPKRVRAVSRETGANIVHGTAFYIEKAHPSRVKKMDQEEIEQEFLSDIEDGLGSSSVHAGIIGEIGTSGEITSEEEKVLRGAANAAVESGAPVSIHPPGWKADEHKGQTYPTSYWGLELLDIVEEEGLPPSRVIVSHCDRPAFELENLEYQMEIADRGAFIEYDRWGIENYSEKYEMGYPSDLKRIDAVLSLIEEGYDSQILFSQDICHKHERIAYGGFGISHILENAIDMLEARGVTSDTIKKILIHNPSRILTFD